MNLAMLLEMAAEGAPERVGLGSRHGGMTYTEMLASARATSHWLAARGGERVGMLDRNSPAMPLLVFGAAMAGKPFAPLNYRLAPEQLRDLCHRLSPATIIAADDFASHAEGSPGLEVVSRQELLSTIDAAATGPALPAVDPEEIAVLLFTSGTTGTPKAAVLRHRHLFSYIISTVDFLGAGAEEAALVSVPPYHIAGISAVLSSVYSGRRLVQLEAFDASEWVRLARAEAVTHAMVVPTMLGRILDVLTADGEGLPALRHLSYGGGRMPLPTIERAMAMLPGVDFVNAYGLTETSSTIAVLSPADHRDAFASDVEGERRRLSSVGRPLPTLELVIRDADGRTLPPGECGEICVRGEQVAGEYLTGGTLDPDGWFPTKDSGYLDDGGFLFIDGRLDDVIVRGGENLSPGEIEECLVQHPGIAEVAVVGLPDPEWGEQVAAAIVVEEGTTLQANEVQSWVRDRLRSSRMPTAVVVLDELPYTDTGKLLRRVLKQQLTSDVAAGGGTDRTARAPG